MSRTLATNRFPVAGLTFDGSQNYLSCGNLGSFGSSMATVYLAFNMKTTSTSNQCIFGAGNSGTATALLVFINATTTGTSTPGKMRVFIRATDGKQIDSGATSAFSFNDGLMHRFIITITCSTNTVTISMDGNSIPISYATQQTPSSFANFASGFAIGARNNAGTISTFAACSLDSIQIGTASNTITAAYFLGEGIGSSATDGTGNGNTGTLTGSPLPTWTTRTLASGRVLASGRTLA